MTMLMDVARAIPENRVEIADIASELNINDLQLGVFQRFFDLRQICTAPDSTYADLLVDAARGLRSLAGNEHRVRYVVGARTIGSVASLEVNPLHEAAARLGLDHAVVFTLTQHACASALLAVDLAGKLLAADSDPDALALVITGEKAFSPHSRVIEGTTVMGEGTAACIVAADSESSGSGDRMLSYVSRTLGEYHMVPLPHDLVAPYSQAYITLLVEVIEEALEKAGTSIDDLALILPHNVNRVSWKRACKQLGFPLGKVLLEHVPEFGHCFGADSFINYVTAHRTQRLQPGDRFLMPSVGLGSTFSAMVFEHGQDSR